MGGRVMEQKKRMTDRKPSDKTEDHFLLQSSSNLPAWAARGKDVINEEMSEREFFLARKTGKGFFF